MNFLAHIYLSGDDDDLLIGNFIADKIKGKDYEKYPPGVKKGILLHRFIDDFTDNHPVVLETKKLFWPNYHKLAPILADMAYDHFLAINWHQYHPLKLADYTERTYQILQSRANEMPDQIQFMLKYMVAHNWLYNYQFAEGMQRALGGLSQRVRQGEPLQNGWDTIVENYPTIEQHFFTFFEELKGGVTQKLTTL